MFKQLEQVSTNDTPQAKSAFVNKVVLGYVYTHSFTYCPGLFSSYKEN